MNRGFGWWGTPPLLVGAAGLLLLAFGAKGMQGDDEINEPARQEADNIEKELNDASQRGDLRDVIAYLQMEEASLRKRGKSADLVSLAPKKKGEDFSTEQAAEARKMIYDALSSERDPDAAIAGRIAFYAGLILVFTAGVLLYRRTPESNRGRW